MLEWMPNILDLKCLDFITHILGWIGNYERSQRG